MGNSDHHSVSRRGFLRAGAAGSVGLTWAAQSGRSAEGLASGGEKPFIWDMHCHLSAGVDPAPRARMAEMKKYAERMGIDRVMVFLGIPPYVHNPSPDQLRKANDQVLEAIEGWPGHAFGLAYVSPEHVEASLSEIERCVSKGPMVGVKLWVAKRCGDEQIDPIVRRNAELKGIFYQHTWFNITGNLPGESTPADVARLSQRHPGVPLICGHAGGDWELGIRTVRAFKDISLEIAGFDPTSGAVEMAVRELGAERVIYGSDVFGRSFASQLSKALGADVADDAKRLILGGNLRRMLTPIFRQKGYNP